MNGREAIEREVEARLKHALPEVDLLEVSVGGRGGSSTLRAVIDHPQGVSLALCAEVTRALGDAGLLDRFAVEVSSPGPRPPLRTTEHYLRAVGKRVRVQVQDREVLDGRKSCTGTLLAAGDQTITIAAVEGVIEVPRSAVARARLIIGDDAGEDE
ncbi:MAG: ribosome maturation factor RimP [Miltoncostaeaceae bacterium]|nr:ribosome maturation factor RimP [Miltoncostaeaceae bacterium]